MKNNTIREIIPILLPSLKKLLNLKEEKLNQKNMINGKSIEITILAKVNRNYKGKTITTERMVLYGEVKDLMKLSQREKLFNEEVDDWKIEIWHKGIGGIDIDFYLKRVLQWKEYREYKNIKDD